MVLIDSHAHVNLPQFERDRAAVIERAWDAGLVGLVNIGTSVRTSRESVALAQEHDRIYATVGIHPHEAESSTSETLGELRSLARYDKVVAIGEIGLDYYRDYSPRAVQRQAFRDQLALASEVRLPVVIHSRDAHEDLLGILSDWKGTGVLHTYAAGLKHLDQVVEMGFFIGISGPITYDHAAELRNVVRAAPLERLLVETDCPYLAPNPQRGKRNEPAYVAWVAQAIAQARRESVERIARETTDNARRLFALEASDSSPELTA